MPAPLSRNRNYQLLLGSKLLSGFGFNGAAIAFPLLVLALMRLNRQYRAEASVLEMSRTEKPVLARYTRHRVLVFVDAIDQRSHLSGAVALVRPKLRNRIRSDGERRHECGDDQTQARQRRQGWRVHFLGCTVTH